MTVYCVKRLYIAMGCGWTRVAEMLSMRNERIHIVFVNHISLVQCTRLDGRMYIAIDGVVSWRSGCTSYGHRGIIYAEYEWVYITPEETKLLSCQTASGYTSLLRGINFL